MTRLVRFSNNAVSRIAANITTTATTISLTPGDGAKFPALSSGQYFMGTLVKTDGTREVVKVTARSTDTLTIVRAAEAVGGFSVAYAFSAGDRFEHRLTSGVLSSELDRLDAAAIITAVNKSADYTITAADVTSLVRCDTTAANLTITLPQISTLSEDFDIIVAKVSSDANTITIVRSGSTDTINGDTSYQIFNAWQSAWMIADRSTGTWTVISSGLNAVNTIVDAGTGDGSTPTLTLSGDPGSKNNVALFVGGVYQQKATFSVSGTTLTPGATIPNGVKWEAVWSVPLTVGTPSDGTVSTVKIVDKAVTVQKLADEASERLVYPGAMMDYAMSSPPTGWLAANGAAVSRTTYAALFAAIGTTFGAGDGLTTFNLPDKRDRMSIGSGSLYGIGAQGGSKDAIVVAHTHTGSTNTTGAHTHNYTAVSGSQEKPLSSGTAAYVSAATTATSSAGDHSHTFTTASTGSSGTNANLPPYLGLLACIKY